MSEWRARSELGREQNAPENTVSRRRKRGRRRKRKESPSQVPQPINNISGTFTTNDHGVAIVGSVIRAKRLHIHGREAAQHQKQKQDLLLKHLVYEEMWDRKNLISKKAGSPDSVRWIWSTDFAAWLRDPNSTVFWITGLPGCGKSTLMKHISDSMRTKTILNEHGDQWTVMNFFFDFSRGTSISNSVPGLIRTFFHQFLSKTKAGAEFITIDDVGGLGSTDDADSEQLMSQLCHVINSTSSRICAFVDGLDEFKGNLNELFDVLSKLRDLTGMKMCVASRQEPTFLQRYSEYPHIAVHEHNDSSIRYYFETTWLTSSHGAKAPSQLCEELLRSAKGNFVWVRGAVHRIQQMLAECQPLHKVLEELKEMPKEVVELYEDALNRHPIVLRREAALLLKLIIEGQGRIELDRLDAAFWTIVKRMELKNQIQDREMFGSVGDRIFSVLGSMVETSYMHASDRCRNLTFIDTAPTCSTCSSTSPRLTHNDSTVAISREMTIEVRLAHETLVSGFRDRPWISENLSKTFLENYPDCLWLRIYIQEIDGCSSLTPKSVASTLAEIHQVHSTLPDMGKFVRMDIYDREEAIEDFLSRAGHGEEAYGEEAYGEEPYGEEALEESAFANTWKRDREEDFDHQSQQLLPIIARGKNWSELAPFAIHLIFDEYKKCPVVSDTLFEQVFRSLSHPKLLAHYAICGTWNRDGRQCAFLRLTSPRRKLLNSTTNPILRALALSVAHGIIEIVDYCLRHNLLITVDEKQVVFELIVERCLSKNGVKQLPNTASVLRRLCEDGCRLQSEQLCLIFQGNHWFYDITKLFGESLGMHCENFFPRSLGKHHVLCDHRSIEDSRLFLIHWLEWNPREYFYRRIGDLRHIDEHDGIEYMLDILLRCGVGINEPLFKPRPFTPEITALDTTVHDSDNVCREYDKFAALVRAGADLTTLVWTLESEASEDQEAQRHLENDSNNGLNELFNQFQAAKKLCERGRMEGECIPAGEAFRRLRLAEINNETNDEAENETESGIDDETDRGIDNVVGGESSEKSPTLESLLAQLSVFEHSERSSLDFESLYNWAVSYYMLRR